MKNAMNLVWLDLEMTGLDHNENVIIEIASIVTDSELNILAEGPNIAIHQPDSELDKMDEWCTRTHGSSGLTRRVRESSISVIEAEQQTLDFIQQWLDAGQSPMCGNSIGTDRRFLAEYMPRLEAFFHYRNLDVSTVKELARRWAPPVYEAFAKEGSHLALDDIRESIEEMRYYRQHFVHPNYCGPR